MKIVKKTKKYFYVELGDKDMEELWAGSDLIRTAREDIDKGYITLSDKVKCDGEYEEIEYDNKWIEHDGFGYKFKLPNDIDKIIENEGN